MGTLYSGERTFYVDDATGIMWDSPQKRYQFNADGTIVAESEKVPDVTVTITEPAKTKTVIEEPETPTLKCDVCGFDAKSVAGLAVHKMRHNEDKVQG